MCNLIEVNWFKLNIKAYKTMKLGVLWTFLKCFVWKKISQKLLHEMPFSLLVNKLCFEIRIELYIIVKLLESQAKCFMN
jgi:hypothetical protein